MTDPLPTIDPGDALGVAATLALRGVLSPAVAKAASVALAAAAKIQAGGFVGTMVADFQSVRRNADLVAATSQATADAHSRALGLLLDALERGFRAVGETEGDAIGLTFAWGPEDAALLAGFPIVEHTAAEHADQLAAGLAFDVQGSVSRVIAGGMEASALPAKLDALGDAWAQRVGLLVADAWHTGANAARHAMMATLSRP